MSTLMTVPYTAVGAGTCNTAGCLFANTQTANDGDIADGAGNFCTAAGCNGTAALGATAYDHNAETELIGSPAGALLTSAQNGVAYTRYWNIAPMGANGVSIAVVVRWQQGSTWMRTVMVGTRYQP
jgi:hypothetical protein